MPEKREVLEDRSHHEVSLPRGVQAAIEQADAIYKEVYPDDPPEGAQEAPAEGEAGAASEQEPPAEPAQPPASEPDGFEHKFNVLQGKYNKEVPRLYRVIRAKDKEINDLRTQLARAKTAPPTPPQPASLDITDEERDMYGEDLINLVDRLATQRAKEMVPAQREPEPDRMEEEPLVDGDREELLAALDEAVPDWLTQNEDPEFLKWLSQMDPYTSKPREQLLADALQTNDADATIALFKGFQQENAVVTPDDQPSEEAPETPEQGTPEQEPEQPLEELVAPGSPKTGSTGAQSESGKRIWTKQGIEEFTREKNEFVKANPERDMPQHLVDLERDLFAAQLDGRIRL
jgi:hypothetical protein